MKHEMYLSTPDSEIIEDDIEGPLGEMEYICIAADLLQQMFSELQSLATNNTRLAHAMADREWHAQDRLWTLRETADLLMCVKDHSTAIPLKRKATVLIGSLSDELDELTLSVVDAE
jgi:hypothetical protein